MKLSSEHVAWSGAG